MSGQELKRRRNALKITQRHMANLLGVTGSILSNWENGRTPIPPYVEQLVEHIAEKLATSKYHKV